MPDLYRCTLNPSGPNFDSWKEVFSTHLTIPLKSAYPITADFGDGEKNVEVYLLNLDAMTFKQRARLFGAMARKFQATVAEVERAIREDGFPIRAVDVIVEISMRAIV